MLFLILGLAPSIIWLLLSLREDAHPESNWMILKIFCYGMLVAIPTAFVEIGFFRATVNLPLSVFTITLINIFIGVAFVEELSKYLVVRLEVFSDPQFDEPVDAMLYMIIAALGFAAVENILIFVNPSSFYPLGSPFILASLRFVGATFLHALVSAIVGYYIALSFLHTKHRKLNLFKGLIIATALHGLYNFSIMELSQGIIIPVAILGFSLLFVLAKFQKLRGIKSICRVTKNN